MLIRNKAKIQKKHPNFDNEIKIIRTLIDAATVIVNTDLTEIANSLDEYNVDIKIKKHFLSNSPKEIKCVIPNGNHFDSGFYEYFDKNFKITHVTHPALVMKLFNNHLFDIIKITHCWGANLGYDYQILFEKESEFEGSIELDIVDNNPVLLRYTYKAM